MDLQSKTLRVRTERVPRAVLEISPNQRRGRMMFTFKLEQPDADRSLRVVDVRDRGDDEPVVLVFEDTPASF